MIAWHLEDSTATLLDPAWPLRIDLADLATGVLIGEGEREARLSLGAGALPPFDDAYVRVSDLIASYSQTDQTRFSMQLDCRQIACSEELLCLEFWVSVQTFLLDSYPKIAWRLVPPSPQQLVCSESVVGADAAITLDSPTPNPTKGSAIAAVYDDYRDDQRVDWCLLIHQLDQREAVLSSWDTSVNEFELSLFGQFMEKGVIRRARMQWIASRDGLSREEMQMHYQSFCKSPLPLTT